MRAGEVLEVVDLRADAGCGFGPIIEVRGHRELLVLDRRQAPGARRAQRQMMFLFLAMTSRCECLRARKREAYRPADFAGCERRKSDVRPNHCLSAKAAADEVGNDT